MAIVDGSGSAAGTPGAPAPETPGVVIGNHTNKYVAKNPAIRFLTNRWVGRLDGFLDRIGSSEAPPKRPLEVGAGEGVISLRLYERFGDATAIDLPDAGLRAEWKTRPGPRYLHANAERLPFRDDEFDLTVCVEVLEHLEDPRQGLAELARVTSRHLLVSVPREPIFRGCNLVTGRYVKDLGNTPGHLNHWSSRGFARFLSQVGRVRAVSRPFPWTVAWVDLTSR
jgi:2-polyprenyl-3-methyl-5-hydroxy-6-metoxy-1,4-benzoquinol methylase